MIWLSFLINSGVHAADFPRQPIKIIVYTGPAGQLNIFARKFTEIAKKYSDATFVVENKQGAGGIVAMKRVFQLPPDGYTLYAGTKSAVAKLVGVNAASYVDDLDWIAMLMADPECVIVRRGSGFDHFEDIIEDGRSRGNGQIWVGPNLAGLDHVTAQKIWDQYQLTPTWIPYNSGGDAIIALLGGDGSVYVGNPVDAVSNPDLQVVAVSSEKRLQQFPDTPTFGELGLREMDDEFMWRGFALRKGCSQEVLNWYAELFERVTADPDWRDFWERDGVRVEYQKPDAFSALVKSDVEDLTHHMRKMGAIAPTRKNWSLKSPWQVACFVLLGVSLLAAIFFASDLGLRHRIPEAQSAVIPSVILCVCFLYLAETFTYPSGSNTRLSAATIPRFWIALIIPHCIARLLSAFRNHEAEDSGGEADEPATVNAVQTRMAWYFLGLMVVFCVVTVYLGFYIASAAFLMVTISMLGLGNRKITAAVTAGWLLFCFVVVAKWLFVPLPIGQWIEQLLL